MAITVRLAKNANRPLRPDVYARKVLRHTQKLALRHDALESLSGSELPNEVALRIQPRQAERPPVRDHQCVTGQPRESEGCPELPRAVAFAARYAKQFAVGRQKHHLSSTFTDQGDTSVGHPRRAADPMHHDIGVLGGGFNSKQGPLRHMPTGRILRKCVARCDQRDAKTTREDWRARQGGVPGVAAPRHDERNDTRENQRSTCDGQRVHGRRTSKSPGPCNCNGSHMLHSRSGSGSGTRTTREAFEPAPRSRPGPRPPEPVRAGRPAGAPRGPTDPPCAG